MGVVGGAFKKDSDLQERLLLNLAFKPFENFDSDLDLKRENSGESTQSSGIQWVKSYQQGRDYGTSKQKAKAIG